MRRLYFWNQWHQPYKNLYWLFFILFLLSLLYGIYNYLIGADQVIHWEVVDKLDQLKLVIHKVMAGNFKFEIPVDNYVIFQYFKGSNLIIHAYNAYIYLVLLVISINLIMAILPSMPKIWFYAGMGGFIGFVVMLKIDQILLFDRTDKTALIIVLGLYLSAGYFFKEVNQNIDLLKRFIIFNLLSLIIVVLFYKYAGVSDPFLHIANYGILAPIIITILFIIFIAHEIIFGFLYLVTSSNTTGSRNSLHHFILISLFYLVYTGLTYMHYTGQISWDLIYLNPFLIAGITFVLGIWGYKRREDLFIEIFSFYPVGALFYLGFGIISMSTVSYIFVNANDPLVETFEDVILYSQIGFGVMFFIYVITNFGPVLLYNMKVAKIVYQSRIFPFFIFRIGGLLVFGYMFYSANFLPYFQSMAGYYNFVGDIFLIEKQLDLAEEYYLEASGYEYQNHRSNYAMATLARLKKDKYDEAYYFNNALLKQPTEFAYINISNIYLQNDQYFDGLFSLQEALKEYPGSYHLLNNMGYYYSRTDISDSSFYYFDVSHKASWKNDVPASNIYGLMAKANIDIPIDTLEDSYSIHKTFAGKANLLAMQNQFSKSAGLDPVTVDMEYNFKPDYFAYLYNTGLHSVRSSNTNFYNGLLKYADSSGMDLYMNRITVLASINRYFNHQVTESFRLLYELGEMSVFDDEYFNMLGILALDLHSPRLAVDYFMRTSIHVNERYSLNLGIAYAEAGSLEQANQIFQSLLHSSDASIKSISSEYRDILNWDKNNSNNALNDEEKYLLLHFMYNDIDPLLLIDLYETIENNSIKALIRIERTERLINKGKIEWAFENFINIEKNTVPSELKTRWTHLKYLFAIHNYKSIADLPVPGSLGSNHPLYLYDHLLYLNEQKDAKDTVRLDSAYNILASWDPFFDEGVIASVEYFGGVRGKDNYAYNLLVNALTVNTYSEVLNKYYIEYCIKDGLIDFARNRLDFIKEFMDGEDFEEYYNAIIKEISLKEANMNSWGS